MKKNPGRKEQRALAKRNRTRFSEKLSAINERMIFRRNKFEKIDRKRRIHEYEAAKREATA